MSLVGTFLLVGCFVPAAFFASTSRPLVTPQNASATILHCPPATNFIQTHMAPDFESPQLVRRLDWFHDDSLVASYQQNVIADSSRQWWVADGRFQLQKPFYALRIAPVLPEDAGLYRCRLETDPLFALQMTNANVELTVMVKPVPPSSPEIKLVTNHSITISWTHTSARAHRPILRYSVKVRPLTDGGQFIIPAPSNATSVIIDNLSPYTSYAISVRAENAAGLSDFGPETRQLTNGNAPEYAPRIRSISNASSGCVSIFVDRPRDLQGSIKAWTIVSSREPDGKPRKDQFPGSAANPLLICDLKPHSAYVISVGVASEFGSSPLARHTFHTDMEVPQFAPSNISVSSEVGSTRVIIRWVVPPGSEQITQYNVYHKAHHHGKWKAERLPILLAKATSFKHELTNLLPLTKYHVRLSASSARGEGPLSEEYSTITDVIIPTAVEISNLSFDCKRSVKLEWPSVGPGADYRIEVSNSLKAMFYNTTVTKLTVLDLDLHEEYAVRVSASVRSSVDNTTILKGPWGKEHRFLLGDRCSYQSSLCKEDHSKCQPLVQVKAITTSSFSYFVGIAALSIFIFLCLALAFVLNGRCVDVKSMLKKKEKCVCLDELAPLVYDSTGVEDIPVELFYGYCEDLARNNNAKYKLQFEQIEQMTSTASSNPELLEKNVDKNRYLNIGAIESSRVRLTSISGSDYINANYIDSCDQRKTYIATQAPLPSTFSDFWAMCWQDRVNVIVVITNLVEDGRRKCDPYWPSTVSSPQMHGPYQVTLVSEDTNAYFIHRVLSVKISKCVPPTERRVHQLHFTGWPDHGVPDSVFPLLSFMHYVSDIHSTGPIVVHCSAGVGRSGSYILIDSMRRHLTNFRRLNLMGHLIHMRRQREKLVQTTEQYILCHEAVRQLIRHGITRVHSDLYQRYLNYLSEENVNGKTRLQMQYEDLCICRHDPKCSVPSNYITLPGYHRLDEFIVANWPSENEQLWELVWQKNCQTLILLGDSKYWCGIQKVGNMTIDHSDNFALLQNNEDQLCVRIVPVSRTALEMDVWTEIERIQKERLSYHDAPLLILNPPPPSSLNNCSNGGPFGRPSSPLSFSTGFDGSPTMAYCICALTALACQLEQTGCLDAVEVLSSYSQMYCGIWSSKADLEFIYDRLTSLVSSSRV